MNIHNTIFAGTQEKSFLGSKYRLKLAVKKKNDNNITKIVINKWIKGEREREREKKWIRQFVEAMWEKMKDQD